VSLVAWLIAESRVTEKTNWSAVGQQLGQLKQAISQKSIWLPTAFLFIWQAMPTADSAFFFFTTNELHFEPEFLGRVRLVTSLASLVGIWLFQRFLKTVPFRIIFGWSTVISAMLGMTTLILVTHANRSLGIDDHWFSLGDNLILTVMGQIAFMPVLVLAARLCPSGVEATLFALLMSIVNLAGMLSYQSGAVLMHWLGITANDFTNLTWLVIITNLSTLLPLPFLSWLPAASDIAPEETQTPALQPAASLEFELDSATSPSKHLAQPFIPDLMTEFVPPSRHAEAVTEE
jgi:folate/biopterin transporter